MCRLLCQLNSKAVRALLQVTGTLVGRSRSVECMRLNMDAKTVVAFVAAIAFV